jgi:Spy/CpxP family protein refolding chaperone
MNKTLVSKSITALAFVLIFQTHMYGQPQGHQPMPPPDRLEHLQKILNLTDAQLEKVKSIFDEQKKEMDKIMQASEDERKTTHESMMKKRKETDKKIIALLDSKQKEKFTEMQKQHEEIPNELQRDDRHRPHERHHMSWEDRPSMPGPMSPEEHMVMLKDDLNLTDSQVAKVKEIFNEQEKEIQKHQDMRQDDPQAMDERMMEKRKEIDGKITAILSAEQKQKYGELRKKECSGPCIRHETLERDK